MRPPHEPSSATPHRDPGLERPEDPAAAAWRPRPQTAGDASRPGRTAPTAATELGKPQPAVQPAEAPAAVRSVGNSSGNPETSTADGGCGARAAAACEVDAPPWSEAASDHGLASPASAPAAPRPARAPAWLGDLAGAWMFYSVLPAWPTPAPRFQRIARFAPWIGAVLGGLQGLLWWLLQGHAPPLAQVCLVLAAGLWLSGGLHMDGAMDTADGLAAGERLLEAMADSRVGASGVQALALVLLLRAAALAWLGPLAPLALLWAAVWGRLAPLIAMARFPYLRQRGSAAFHRRHWAGLARELRPALPLFAALGLLTWSLRGPNVLPLGQVLLGLPPALLVPLWLGRRLGGHSGDSYGACVEWSESLALLLMAALPLGVILA